MEIEIGDKVIYTFPNPVIKNKRSVKCIVESMDEFYIILKTEDNVRLKVTFKNFEYLKPVSHRDYSEAI